MLRIIVIFALLIPLNCLSQNIVSVTGKSTVSVKPDMITMSFSIYNTKIISLEKAKRDIDLRTKNVIKYLLNLGISEKDIASDGFQLEHDSDYEEDCKKKYVHEIGRSFDIKLKDLSKYDEVINTLVNLGVSEFGYIEPQITNRERYEKQALKLAIDDARSQAEFLVENFGGKLGAIANIGHRKVTSQYYGEEELIVTGIRASIAKNAHFYFSPALVEIDASIYAEFSIE